MIHKSIIILFQVSFLVLFSQVLFLKINKSLLKTRRYRFFERSLMIITNNTFDVLLLKKPLNIYGKQWAWTISGLIIMILLNLILNYWGFFEVFPIIKVWLLRLGISPKIIFYIEMTIFVVNFYPSVFVLLMATYGYIIAKCCILLIFRTLKRWYKK